MLGNIRSEIFSALEFIHKNSRAFYEAFAGGTTLMLANVMFDTYSLTFVWVDKEDTHKTYTSKVSFERFEEWAQSVNGKYIHDSVRTIQ